MDKTWEKLLASALVGTGRQTPDLSHPEGALGQLLAQIDLTDSEGAILNAAAVITTYIRAGTQATTFNGSALTPCDREDAPYCSALTRQHLQTILSGSYRPVLLELLESLQAVGQLVPADCLPSLLDLGRHQSPLRELIQAVSGKRGRWLAQYNEDWRYLGPAVEIPPDASQGGAEALQERWQTGTKATRLAIVQALRAIAPAQARTLLATTWTQEKAKDRAAFLEQLQIALSWEDEPFLEATLDDRSQEVRALAADLLKRLPMSQLCQRMTMRVKSFVHVHPTTEGVTLQVALPDALDPDWERDGLVATQQDGLGQRANLLVQILSAVPLQVWSEQVSIEALLQAASHNEWRAEFLKGWELAAQKQQNVPWSLALITHALNQTESEVSLERWPTVGLLSSPLWSLLPAADREQLLTQWLTQLWSAGQREVWRSTVRAIAQSRLSPSLDFSQMMLMSLLTDWTETASPQVKYQSDQLRSEAEQLAYYLDPQVAPTLEHWMATHDHPELENDLRGTMVSDRPTAIAQCLEILNFRLAVRQAVQSFG
jgi:hypothetical protein